MTTPNTSGNEGQHSGGGFTRGQWFAYDQVLHWLNTQEALTLRKTDVYAAVMALRPTGSVA